MRRRALVILALFCGIPAWAQAPATPSTPAKPEASTKSAATPEAPAKEDAIAARGNLLEGYEDILKSMDDIQKHVAAQEAAGPEPAGTPLKLDAHSCVQLALTQNAQVLVAQDDADAAKAKVGQAWAGMKPTIKASTGFSHTEMNGGGLSSLTGGGLGGLGGSSSLGGGLGGIGGIGGIGGGGILGGLPFGGVGVRLGVGILAQQFITKLTSSQMDTSTPEIVRQDKVTLQQVFYAGGQIRAAIKASKFLAESQEWKKEVTVAQVELDAKKAYYDALTAGALVKVAEASVRSFERNRSDAQQMFDVGMSSNFEVLRANTELGSRKANLVAAHDTQQLAMANLRRIIAVPQSTPIELSREVDWRPSTPQLDQLTAYADEHRPEILALKKGILAAEQDIKRVNGQYKPQVVGNVQWENTDNGGITQPDGWTFSVGASMDIYAGGKRKYERAESKARLSSLKDQLTDLEHLIELDVTQAMIQIKDSMAKVASENGTRQLAEEGLRLAELRFQEGVGTQSETLDAELALTNAETQLVQALRDFAVAHASLEHAIGVTWSKPMDSTAPDTGEVQAADQPK